MSVWDRELPPIEDKKKPAPTPPWERAAVSTTQQGKTVDKKKPAPTPPWEQAAGSTTQKGKPVNIGPYRPELIWYFGTQLADSANLNLSRSCMCEST